MVEWPSGYELNAPRMYQPATVAHPISEADFWPWRVSDIEVKTSFSKQIASV
jgi:hypothetical protein